MISSSETASPSTGRVLRGWLWRGAVVLAVPPLVTLAVFLTGLAINGLRTDYYELRFGVVLFLCGPDAPGIGFTTSVLLSSSLFGRSRFARMLTVATGAVNLVTAFVTWGQAFRHFIGVGWG